MDLKSFKLNTDDRMLEVLKTMVREAVFPIDYYDAPTVNIRDQCLRSHRRIREQAFFSAYVILPFTNSRGVLASVGETPWNFRLSKVCVTTMTTRGLRYDSWNRTCQRVC